VKASGASSRALTLSHTLRRNGVGDKSQLRSSVPPATAPTKDARKLSTPQPQDFILGSSHPEKRAVGPTRLANSGYRSREHRTPSEVEKLIEAAKTNRYGHRDATMVVQFGHDQLALIRAAYA
jgi:hypothetical protein